MFTRAVRTPGEAWNGGEAEKDEDFGPGWEEMEAAGPGEAEEEGTRYIWLTPFIKLALERLGRLELEAEEGRKV